MAEKALKISLPADGEATERPITIAIVAMGGQGGGVLTNWIVHLAETQGWVAQSTSVPGVAQRTGATIYYVEMMPANKSGQKPILSLMPTPGDVDVVLASEFMEAGRSILRGIVTPERTTLIASDHRSLAIVEKMAPGNGIADSGAVDAAVEITAKVKIIFDMNALAITNGSVISSALFGCLAASGAFPFERAQYYDVIRAGGKGVEASIRTFDAAYERSSSGENHDDKVADVALKTTLPEKLPNETANRLLERLRSEIPTQSNDLALAGLNKVVDYQDPAYGDEYLDLLANAHALDKANTGAENNYQFTTQTAKYLANAMVYDDLVRVADLKTRATRRDRVKTEIGLREGQLLQTTEYMHPRLEEVISIFPKGLANWLIARQGLYKWIDRRINKGRHVRTYSFRWFTALYIVGGLKSWRRRSLRHDVETRHRDEWLSTAFKILPADYKLSLEVIRARRLIKGYSDTHIRGLSKFDKIMVVIEKLSSREDAAKWASRMIDAAIKDASGDDLDATIKTIESFL